MFTKLILLVDISFYLCYNGEATQKREDVLDR